jgi:diadenosine tetraphosphate (Ap4A) HIT family hydrolase
MPVTHDVQGCIACDLSRGRRELPGGTILSTSCWRVEHCVGPLGVGTLIVKPLRHILHLADLDEGEAVQLGPLLRRTALVVTGLCNPDQVYVCLWSHGPAHIHFVVQPVSEELMTAYGAHGPALQVGMFETGDLPDAREVETFADGAREQFARI